MTGVVFGELGRGCEGLKVSGCETVVILDFGHDDESVWQGQPFGCLGLIFQGRRGTL